MLLHIYLSRIISDRKAYLTEIIENNRKRIIKLFKKQRESNKIHLKSQNSVLMKNQTKS